MPSTRRTYTRVAVVQLDYQPAALIQRRSLLEEPLFALAHTEALLPTDGTVPEDRVSSLFSRFANARTTIEAFCAERRQEVGGHFVEPDVLVNDSDARQPALAALDAWLEAGAQTVLVLGKFGCGKSTLLARWASQRWQQGATPLPILCNLAGAGPSANALTLLLRAAGQDDTLPDRAALTLLLRRGLLLPCFDGFDEMATRVTPTALAGRLAELLRVASDGGRVVISSRDHYFPSEAVIFRSRAQFLQKSCSISEVVFNTLQKWCSTNTSKGTPYKWMDCEGHPLPW